MKKKVLSLMIVVSLFSPIPVQAMDKEEKLTNGIPEDLKLLTEEERKEVEKNNSIFDYLKKRNSSAQKIIEEKKELSSVKEFFTLDEKKVINCQLSLMNLEGGLDSLFNNPHQNNPETFYECALFYHNGLGLHESCLEESKKRAEQGHEEAQGYLLKIEEKSEKVNFFLNKFLKEQHSKFDFLENKNSRITKQKKVKLFDQEAFNKSAKYYANLLKKSDKNN